MTAEKLRSLVVDATPGAGVERRIEAALQIAGEQEAALSIVCAAWPASMSIADALVQNPVHSMVQEQDMRSAIATSRSTFDRVVKDSPLSAEWCDGVGDPGTVLREHGLLADLIVTGLPGDANIVQADPVDLAASTGTPVLRVGAAPLAQGFRRGLIGWKDCREIAMRLASRPPPFAAM
ncbi:hypothetical protein F1640_20225 [Novosphingobium sp. NBM11]|uniref:hypothetical protein n=1 Tax=Novosphingobium sp. NBM11 TaxID=2596914 RepID=UPI0018922D97|nr:hypothetical protein [Novosphingobium sp. NBM11]MBF5092258.1 hypothetical protein [Novosphingobium sp. NBM11]